MSYNYTKQYRRCIILLLRLNIGVAAFTAFTNVFAPTAAASLIPAVAGIGVRCFSLTGWRGRDTQLMRWQDSNAWVGKPLEYAVIDTCKLKQKQRWPACKHWTPMDDRQTRAFLCEDHLPLRKKWATTEHRQYCFKEILEEPLWPGLPAPIGAMGLLESCPGSGYAVVRPVPDAPVINLVVVPFEVHPAKWVEGVQFAADVGVVLHAVTDNGIQVWDRTYTRITSASKVLGSLQKEMVKQDLCTWGARLRVCYPYKNRANQQEWLTHNDCISHDPKDYQDRFRTQPTLPCRTPSMDVENGYNMVACRSPIADSPDPAGSSMGIP